MVVKAELKSLIIKPELALRAATVRKEGKREGV